MNNRLNSLIKYVICLVLLGLVTACGSSDTPEAKTDNATTEMPGELQKLTLPGGGTLSAFVTIDGNTADRVELTIDSSGAGSASGSFAGLSLASHTVLITYEYTDTSSFGTIILASASTTVDLTSGSGSISFVAADYDLNSHDEDGDGISNAAELANGTDPVDGGCVIGFSVIGSCTLS